MVSVAFTGDISFSKYFSGAYKRDFIAEEVKSFLKSSDHVIANVECPVTGGDIKSDRLLNHVTPPEAVPRLLECGATVWTLANNHIMDCEAAGMEETLRTAERFGCTTIGAGKNLREAVKPIYFEGAGGIGVFAVTYERARFLGATAETAGCVLMDEIDLIRETIAEIKSKCRWCVMVCHGGGEFSQLPLPYFRKRYLQYLDLGADIIVGHHPHVTENYEKIGEKTIFYSLGNFIFDTDYQRAQRFTDRGVLLKLQFEENAYFFDALGIAIDRETQSIEAAELPAIFHNVPAKQYDLLWPLGVWDFLQNEKASRLNLHPDWTDKDAAFWRQNVKEHYCECPKDFDLGRIHYRLGYWRLGDKVVKDYILGK